MEKRVQGVYPTMKEALQAVDRLKAQGYARNNIMLIANAEVRARLTENVDVDMITGEINSAESSNRIPERNEARSLWNSIKEAFTFDASDDFSEDKSVFVHRDAVDQGHILILVDDDSNTKIVDAMSNIQLNTFGSDETRTLEDEQMLGSPDEYLNDQNTTDNKLNEDFDHRH